VGGAAEARLPMGSRLSGVVVARYPFGAFRDIGAGFPPLLEIVCVEGLTPSATKAATGARWAAR